MQLTNDSDEFVSEPGCLGGEQGERGSRVFQVHVDGVDVDAAPLAHGRYGFPARTDFLFLSDFYTFSSSFSFSQWVEVIDERPTAHASV